MYFLPEEEIEGCTLSWKVENNFKLIWRFDLLNQPTIWANIPEPATIGCIVNALEVLPLLVVIHVMKGLKKYKLYFADISGSIFGRIKVEDILCDNGFESFRITAKAKSNYIVLFSLFR